MSHNAKNYTVQGGDLTVIGGTLRIEGKMEYAEGAEAGIPACANQADSTASTIAALKDDFNTLLTKLKAVGLMEADTPAPEPEPEPTQDPDPDPEPEGEGS